jgi:hypothetical protein
MQLKIANLFSIRYISIKKLQDALKMIEFTETELTAIASLCRREIMLRIEKRDTLRLYRDILNAIDAYLTAPTKL